MQIREQVSVQFDERRQTELIAMLLAAEEGGGRRLSADELRELAELNARRRVA